MSQSKEFLPVLQGVKWSKTWVKAAYVLGIKIYGDRSRCLIELSQSTYLDKILKKFKMDQSKKKFLPVVQGMKLSETQN
jgi:hypothetical protein